nr:MAG TPA: hypothetical protein [Microviridae sp.]
MSLENILPRKRIDISAIILTNIHIRKKTISIRLLPILSKVPRKRPKLKIAISSKFAMKSAVIGF